MPLAKGKVRIAVDAMGGDHAPAEVIKGAVAAAQSVDTEIILVGPMAAVQAELSKFETSKLAIKIVNADEFVKEGEPPALILRQKRNASVIIAAKLVKSGDADAVVSAGPTGAVVASALTILGMPQGIERPVVGGPFLGFHPNTILMDYGGNVDCKPFHLLNFAIVGAVYARKMLNIPSPTIGLLSIGSEQGKGNELVKETYLLLQKSGLNFIGNIEGNDLATGKANVIICDGFVGNILLKFCEGLGTTIAGWLKSSLNDKIPGEEIAEITGNLFSLTNGADMIGGAPLLGVNGVAMVMHGRSQAAQFTRAIAQAKALFQSGIVEEINTELAKTRRQLEDTTT
jgi:phosphate acyltransferase